MTVAKEKILYIFIDESGDFTFSQKGSNFFILTSVSTLEPIKSRDVILKTRYKLLSDGQDLEYFHATEDIQKVRDLFYENLKHIDGFEIDSVVAEKRKANTALYEELTIDARKRGWNIKKNDVEERFYKQLCETLLQYVIHRYINIRSRLEVKKIIVILDNCVVKRKREYVTKYIKQYTKEKFGLVPYIYFHQTKSDVNCQIADYCCWAIKKKWDDKEIRPYEEIKDNIKSEFDIFRNGTKHFY